MTGKIVIDEEKCKGCGYCIDFCPQKVIKPADYTNAKDYHPAVLVDPEGKCKGCGICYLVCPDVAIEVYKEIEGGKK